jgi:hypothetical protein
MSKLINVYCDESCHLESSRIVPANRFMVIGGISCSDDYREQAFRRIREIIKDNGLHREIKWTKTHREAYKDLIHFFFDCEQLAFRAVVVDKEQLQHQRFGQSHDDFYYKIYWQMLEWFIEPSKQPEHHYHIYLDIKDTKGSEKVKKLQNVLCNSQHDFEHKKIRRIQEIRSHEVALMQLTDLLIGSVSFANRYENNDRERSPTKQELVNLIKECSGVSLRRSTSLGARKFNLFHWEGRRT